MQLNEQDLYSDNLATTQWIGEVTDIKDPEYLGRIKVKVFGKFDGKDFPQEDIPWAYPRNNIISSSKSGGSFFSVPKLGSIVNIYFDNGNLYHPEWSFIQKISDELQTELKDSYENFQSLFFDVDEQLKLYYSKAKGFYIEVRETIINLDKDNNIKIKNKNGDLLNIMNDGTMALNIKEKIQIDTKELIINSTEKITLNTKESIINSSNKLTINTKEAIVNADSKAIVKSPDVLIDSQKISLGDGAAESLVLGDSFLTYFNTHVHIANLGAPTSPPSPPVGPMLPTLLSKISKTL